MCKQLTYSLGETQALTNKAAKGAGYPWGLAEELGLAVRWLCARGLPGLETAARLLELRDDGLNDRQCPIIQGTALCDGVIASDAPPAQLGPLICPLLCVPFAAWAAQQFDWELELQWPSNCFRLFADGQSFYSSVADVSAISQIVLCNKPLHEGTLLIAKHRPKGDQISIETLNQFANRTYAPATEASRLTGAGAGLSDND